MESIWTTIEAHCWASELGYAEYVKRHSMSVASNSSPLSEEGYATFCDMLDNEMAICQNNY